MFDPVDSVIEAPATSTTPRITVSTEGPEQWAVMARNRLAANKVRSQLEAGGLDCGSIEKRKKGFLFLVDGSSAANESDG